MDRSHKREEQFLTLAITLAQKGHAGQADKGGEPYINHVLRVMDNVTTLETKTIAVLHDLIEDTDYTLDNLRHLKFTESIVAAVNALTRKRGERYSDYIARVAESPLATEVKIADLRDNMDLGRIPSPSERDHQLKQRYARALLSLEAESCHRLSCKAPAIANPPN